MKHILSLLAITFLYHFSNAQNVGIGTTTPAEKLNVDSGNIKIGKAIWNSTADDRFIKFGDGEFVGVGEASTDDWMELHARKFTFVRSAGTVSPFIEINGNVKIVDGTQGARKILTSTSDGTASWQGPTASTASFKATKTTTQAVFSGATWSMSFPNTDYNDGSNFSSDVFTAPTTGLYHFDIKLMWSLTATASRYNLFVALQTSGTEISRTQYFIEPGTSGNFTSDLSLDVKLSAGQSVYAGAYQASGSTQNVLAPYTTFSGHRLY